MPEINLGYGDSSFAFKFDQSQYTILTPDPRMEIPLRDEKIGEAFDSPIDSRPLDEIVSPEDSVLIVASDATRATGSAQVVNLLVRRVIQYGVSPSNIAIIFATGIHRTVTTHEKADLLSPFIAQRIKTLNHDAYDAASLVHIGTTEQGAAVEVNRALREFERVIIVGGVGFHYFAGFTGGRKSISPGLASAATIEATHMLALDFESGGRRAGVGTGFLEGNAVHEACEGIAAMIDPAFAINTIVDEKGRVVGLFCGHWRSSHRAACDYYLNHHSVYIHEKRKLVITSCGGSPYDINLIQAHKALDMASYACAEGGAIVLLAECRDGLGRPDFLKWFDEADSRALERRLRSGYEVNGQTAWALLTKAERYRVYLISNLDDALVRKMRMIPVRGLAEAINEIGSGTTGYIMSRGAAVLPRVFDH
ncbi:MAG TPA: nickel-dependent lactate racemase [Pyrinomonadaceae bacterium]|nr:nickel-dependent lactate racemase [Pyrinomonadaceae bacterium]